MIALDKLAEELKHYFKTVDYLYELPMPMMLTVQIDAGYRKKAFAGGEQLNPISAYAGKRNNIIFVFEVREGRSIVEMTAAEATSKLEYFTNLLDTSCSRYGTSFTTVYRVAQKGGREIKKATKRQTVRDLSAKYPQAGSWLSTDWI